MASWDNTPLAKRQEYKSSTWRLVATLIFLQTGCQSQNMQKRQYVGLFWPLWVDAQINDDTSTVSPEVRKIYAACNATSGNRWKPHSTKSHCDAPRSVPTSPTSWLVAQRYVAAHSPKKPHVWCSGSPAPIITIVITIVTCVLFIGWTSKGAPKKRVTLCESNLALENPSWFIDSSH